MKSKVPFLNNEYRFRINEVITIVDNVKIRANRNFRRRKKKKKKNDTTVLP